MKQTLSICVTFAGILSAGTVLAGEAQSANGEVLFNELQCAGCHDPVKDQLAVGMGPALTTIAATYTGQRQSLVDFLKHKEKPKVSPENFMVMELQLFTLLEGKSDAELAALADYLLAYQPPVPPPEPAAEATAEGATE